MNCKYEGIKWFLKQVSVRSLANEKSLWTEWLNWQENETNQIVRNNEVEWTIVGDPEVVFTRTRFFEAPLANEVQTFTHHSKERHPIFQWLTLHYIPLDKLHDIALHSPVTLFVQNKIDPRARPLFTQEKLTSLVSDVEFKLPRKHQSIQTFIHPNWTVNELIQPIIKKSEKVEKEAIQIVHASEQYILQLKLLQTEEAKSKDYWQIIDDCLADILNRYWLINNPTLVPWSINVMTLIGKLKRKLAEKIKRHHVEDIMKEINEWSRQIAQLDPRFKD